MKRALLFSLIAFAILSCKKKEDDTRAYSTWYVNGQKFTTNDVGVTKTPGATGWQFIDGNYDGFAFTFLGGIYPGQSLPLSDGKRIFNTFLLRINSKPYLAPDDTFFLIHPKLVAEKIQFSVDTEWLYNYTYQNDSVIAKGDSILVWGTFSEP